MKKTKCPRKCSQCGIDLEWYGEKREYGLVSHGWHSKNQENSFDYNLCNECCYENFAKGE